MMLSINLSSVPLKLQFDSSFLLVYLRVHKPCQTSLSKDTNAGGHYHQEYLLHHETRTHFINRLFATYKPLLSPQITLDNHLQLVFADWILHVFAGYLPLLA
ncbi:hypothetical protein CDAR_211501 [Caerostris darwini]|uniref:Uncharacterized protein n=1 Tax=Caerostris darwini TaxID=1538125 RepID=A0AAV4P5J5_9ARAC|nr:hypothetical protein CDAR_211501 [Caerostris darwini]